MIVGILVIHLHIPGSQSLKDKRMVVRKIKDRIRNRFNVSVTETDGQNTWQRCELAFSMVAVQQAAVERELLGIVETVESFPEVAMSEYYIDYC